MLGLLVATTALHAEERRPTRGERLALEGRCQAAIPELERELAAAPEPGRIAWRLGQCLLRTRHYPAAVVALERALAEEPELAEAHFDLARARYHTRDLVGADASLRVAEPTFSDEAIWNLYRGMVDLERGDPRAAVAALERAVALNASGFRTRPDLQAVEPIASYYLGIALREAGDEERAISVLREVAEGWAGTDWATEAGRELDRYARRRAFLTLGAGAEYDDNVVLSGRDTPLPSDISDEADLRAVWTARGGAELGSWGDTSSGVRASYRGRAHRDGDLRDFDSHFPTASLWVNHALRADTHLRLRYDFGYAWVDTDPFVLTNGGRMTLIRAWSPRQSSAITGSVYADEYLFSTLDVPDGSGTPGADCPSLPPGSAVCGPPGLDERRARDRDGWGLTAGLTHGYSPSLPRPLPTPSLHGGYTFRSFDADGREYSHREHKLRLGVNFALPFGVGLDLDGSWAQRVYRHPSTFPKQRDLRPGQEYFLSNLRRRERIYTAAARLSVPLVDDLSAQASYRYRDSRSSVDVFDYDQHVVGLVFQYTFSRS